MKENLDRLTYDLDLICMDVFDYKPKKLFDIILLDPPCTATGTIGKNPDLQFLNPIDKLEELSDIQQKMLECCARLLTDDGYIIYSVCSLLKEEGENQISRFLRENENLGGTEGFYIAYLQLKGKST